MKKRKPQMVTVNVVEGKFYAWWSGQGHSLKPVRKATVRKLLDLGRDKKRETRHRLRPK